MKRLSLRTVVTSAVVVLLVAAAVWAATEVTVTKTSSKYATALYFDVGNFYAFATVTETNNAYFLTYGVYDYTLPGWAERGSGAIDSGDVSWTNGALSLDTNTEDIAIIGDGGDIQLTWDFAPDNATERTSKTTIENLDTKQTIFDSRESASAVVDGDFLGEDFSGTGTLQVRDGKVILQVK